jgi:hypothetical protein
MVLSAEVLPLCDHSLHFAILSCHWDGEIRPDEIALA